MKNLREKLRENRIVMNLYRIKKNLVKWIIGVGRRPF